MVHLNYILFGGKGQPKGGMEDYLGAHVTIDEAVGDAQNRHLDWYQVAGRAEDETLVIVKTFPVIAPAEGGFVSPETVEKLLSNTNKFQG